MQDPPVAWFITWTTYGTWLPGDERGHVSDTFYGDGSRTPKKNIPGTPYAKGDAHTRAFAAGRQKHETVWLNQQQAIIAAKALVEAASKRGWHIRRAALMAGHVHVLIRDCPDDGPAVRRILKGVSQASLSKAEGKARRWWTRSGSNRRRSGERSIAATDKYVADQKGKLVEIVDMQVVVLALD